VRRNRAAAVAAAAITIAFIAALAISTAAFVHERRVRVRAAAAERAREEARKATEAETIRADTVANFLIGFIDGVVPGLYQEGQRTSIKELLDTADRMAAGLSNAPLAEARLRLISGRAFDEALFETADASRQVAIVERLALRLGAIGPEVASLARMRTLAAGLWDRLEDTAACVETLRQLRQLGDDALARNPPSPNVAGFCRSVTAEYNMMHGSTEEAERLARESVRLCRAQRATHDPGLMAFAGKISIRYRSWSNSRAAVVM
jgi:hypothetical protein